MRDQRQGSRRGLDDRAYSKYRNEFWKHKAEQESQLVEILGRSKSGGVWL